MSEFEPQVTPDYSDAPSTMLRMRDAMTQDDGYIEAKMAAVITSVAVMGALGLIDRGIFGVETDLSVDYGKGTLDATYVMPANYCHGGYITHVKGAKAKVDIKPRVFGHSFSITDTFSEEFDGHLTSQVCNTGTDGTTHIDFTQHKEAITIPEAALNTTVYRTDPLEKDFESDKGFVAAQTSGEIDLLNTIPGVHLRSVDDLQTFLRGLAELAAQETASKVCGEKAWGHLKVAYVEQIKQDEAASLNLRDPSNYQWKPENITVTAPETVAFATQYKDLLNETLAKLKGKNVNISQPDSKAIKNMKCDDASGPTTVMPGAGGNTVQPIGEDS